ncbi:MAG: Gfo/Idh/MocA family oxidoreductase [Armatimonadetes bacterium]|nr:Gfo/Idh/MocA family oxidoreductase [Armatimonadota bacterium]
MAEGWSRRQFIERLGLAGLAAAVPLTLRGTKRGQENSPDLPKIEIGNYPKPDRPITAVVCGYGGRGGYYGWMAGQIPEEWQIVGVAEPIGYRRDAAIKLHKIAPENTFTTWEHVFNRPKFADAIVVSTQDAMHTGPTLKAIEMGYDVLLEKPIAQSWRECEAILKAAQKNKSIVGVCHVLRYAPYFMMMREVIRSGMIGDVVSVQHLEPVEHHHFSHSYVRGPWGNKRKSNPVILSKSCHDLDILAYIIGKPITRVSAFGDLSWFRKENAPKGAPMFCSEGCPVEKTCPYYAQDFYVHKRKWDTHHIITPDRSDPSILRELEKGQYGRCVYHCDNDVCDHMVTNLEFGGGATASLQVEAMFAEGGRRTRVFCQKGHIEGDMTVMQVVQFEPGKVHVWDGRKANVDLSGHGGGDMRLVRDFCQAVSKRDANLLTSSLSNSMESHRAGFLAEESRLQGGQPRGVRRA